MYVLDFFRLVPKSRKVKINRKKGVILSNPGGIKRYIFYISNILVIFSLSLLVYIYFPVAKAVINYKAYERKIDNSVAIQNQTKDEERNTDVFLLSVPKILAEAKVIANVSPSDKETFTKILENGSVAMATGSDSPGYGNGGSIYMFSHSTLQDIFGARKNAVFYLLGELVEGDQIYVYFEGNKYVYEVYNSQVVAGSETKYLDYKEEDAEILILQTCWPLGTNWKRLLVFARRVDAMK